MKRFSVLIILSGGGYLTEEVDARNADHAVEIVSDELDARIVALVSGYHATEIKEAV